MNNKSKNKRLFWVLLTVGIGMLGMAYAFVPLYSMFCQLLGIPEAKIVVGREGLAEVNPQSEEYKSLPSHNVTVRFMGNSANKVPIILTPVSKKITGSTGESALTAYTATNTSNRAIKGVAVHTIVAQSSSGGEQDVSGYVDLQQCFCFEEQVYPPNETITLPLSFTVTKDIPKNIHTIMFGYTVFEAEE